MQKKKQLENLKYHFLSFNLKIHSKLILKIHSLKI